MKDSKLLSSLLSCIYIIYIFVFIHQSSFIECSSSPPFTIIDGDVCYITGSCEVDPVTKDFAPINVMGRVFSSTANADWINVDKPEHIQWTKNNNISVIYHRPDAERLRSSLPQLLYSSTFDVFSWQSIEPIQNDVYDLSELAINLTWASRYSPRLLEKTKVNGKILAIPDRYKFWGIWYKKSLFTQLNLTVPKTWPEFINVCNMIKILTNKVPVGLGSKDNWQGMTWWEMIALRRGGVSWYNKMTLSSSGPADSDMSGINFATDPIHLLSWKYIEELLPFFPQPLSITKDYDQLGAYYKWVNQDWAMILSTSLTATVPIQISQGALKNEEYDFFPFPQLNPDLPVNETGEFSSFTIMAVNKYAKQMTGALKYIEWMSSDAYNAPFANYTAGAAFGLQTISPFSSTAGGVDQVLKRGFDYLNSVPHIINMIDTGNMANWAAVMKPYWTSFFTGSITSTDTIVSIMEQKRIEILFQTVSPPIILISNIQNNIVSLSCPTLNASIYYSAAIISENNNVDNLNVDNTYILYQNASFELFTNTKYRLRAYARKPLMKDSAIVELSFVTNTISSYYDGYKMNQNNLTPLSIIMFCLFFIASLIFLLSLDNANRNKSKKILWISFGSIPFHINIWAIVMMLFYTITWEQEIKFDLRLSISSVLIFLIFGTLGDYLLIFNFKSLKTRYVSNNRDKRINSNSRSLSLSNSMNINSDNNGGQDVPTSPKSPNSPNDKTRNHDDNSNTTKGPSSNILIISSPQRLRIKLYIQISFCWSFGIYAMETLIWNSIKMINCDTVINYGALFGGFILIWIICCILLYIYMTRPVNPLIRTTWFCTFQTIRIVISFIIHFFATDFIYRSSSLSLGSPGSLGSSYVLFIIGGVICGIFACFAVISTLITLKGSVVESDWTIMSQIRLLHRNKQTILLQQETINSLKLNQARLLSLAPFCHPAQLDLFPYRHLKFNNINNNNNNTNDVIPSSMRTISPVSPSSPHIKKSSISPNLSSLNSIHYNHHSIEINDKGESEIAKSLVQQPQPQISATLDELLNNDDACYIFMVYASTKKREEFCFLMQYKYLKLEIELNQPRNDIIQHAFSMYEQFFIENSSMMLNIQSTFLEKVRQKFQFNSFSTSNTNINEYLTIFTESYENVKQRLIIPNFITELNSPIGGEIGRFWLKVAYQNVYAEKIKKNDKNKNKNTSNINNIKSEEQKIILGSINKDNKFSIF